MRTESIFLAKRSTFINSIAAKTVQSRATGKWSARKDPLTVQCDTALRLTMRRIAATLTFIVALLFSAGSAWADFDDGEAAYRRGDLATAFQEWLPLAEQGDARAQSRRFDRPVNFTTRRSGAP